MIPLPDFYERLDQQMTGHWVSFTRNDFYGHIYRRENAHLQRAERAQVQASRVAEKHHQSRRIERRERNAKKQRAVKHGNNKRVKELK
jgi:hypothetical protein